jgi:hypothetical protein
MAVAMESARIWLGILVAVGLPATLPLLQRRALAPTAAAAAYGAYTIFPVWSGWRAVVAWSATTVVAHLVHRSRRTNSGGHQARPLRTPLVDRVKALSSQPTTRRSALVMTIPILVLTISGTASVDAARDLITNNGVAIILSGFLCAVFIGGRLVALVVQPFSEIVGDRAALLGVRLGWIERALVFTFIAGGQPEAAALAIAAKSLVRLPDIPRHKEPDYGQYVVVGTLTSLLVAVAAGIVVRLALKLPPL